MAEIEDRGPASLRDALQPLRDHRSLIIVFVLSAILSALALTYIYSERYRAQTLIFFKPSDVTRLGTHSVEALGSPFPETPFKVITQTVYGLVGSDALLRRIVIDLHLEVPQPRDLSGPRFVHVYKELKYALEDCGEDLWKLLKWGRIIPDDPVDNAIGKLKKQIKISNDDSYVYSLQVTANTPQRAAAIADDLGARLVDLLRNDDLRSLRNQSERLARLRDDKAGEFATIEARMRDLLARSQIASLRDELTEATARVSRLSKEQADTSADLQQSDAKLAEIAGKLSSSGPWLETGDADPAIARRVSRLGSGDYARLTSQKLDAEVSRAAYRGRRDSIDLSYAAALSRLQVLNQVQAQYDVLSERLNAVKRDYKALTDAYQESVIEATTGQSELHVESEANSSPLPVSPIKVYHVGLAGLLAAFFAIGLAYVFDYFGITLFLPPASAPRRPSEPALAPSLAPEAAVGE